MLTKGEITIECCVDNFVLWWRSPYTPQMDPHRYYQALQKQPRKSVPDKEVEETMLELLQPFTEGQEENEQEPLPDAPKASPGGSAKPVAK